ncbi:MAG: hypothetical protein ABI871_08495 [Chthoniobacterales bacterium]
MTRKAMAKYNSRADGRNFTLPLLAGLAVLSICSIARAQDTESSVHVSATADEFEELGGYGQPQWAERSRASATTRLYVLSPYEFYAGIVSESDFPRHGKSNHDLTQEIELGLPHRFELGIENDLGISGRHAEETNIGVAARYAFGAWEKIPLNPAISAEYNFGIGKRIARDRFVSGKDRARRDEPDSYELRLLLGQEFIPRVQWASNLFFRQDLGGPRERDAGFTQDVYYVVIPDKVQLGASMRYTHRENHASASGNEFIIGPSVTWKPNRHTVVDLAPLLGCTHDSPHVAAFLSISYEFGGGESQPPGRSASANR